LTMFRDFWELVRFLIVLHGAKTSIIALTVPFGIK
jgi:hypothetical protein